MNKKNSSLVTPIILAGGSGTRLWPLSRSEKPKQFLTLINEYSLLQLTLKRLENKMFSNPIIVTGETHRFILLEQLKKIGLNDKCKIILEPSPKNTTVMGSFPRSLLARAVPSPRGTVPATIGVEPIKFTSRSIRCMEPPLPPQHPFAFP